jgi:hypothetical protein
MNTTEVRGEKRMKTTEVRVLRSSVVSSRPFDEVLVRLAASIARPDMREFNAAITAARTAAELERVVRKAVGPSDLMEFIRFDLGGDVLRKERDSQGPRMVRLLVGNPLIMQEFAKTVPDVGAYAPATILVDERLDGVHLSYDSIASHLAPYGSETALALARDVDAKILTLLAAAAE